MLKCELTRVSEQQYNEMSASNAVNGAGHGGTTMVIPVNADAVTSNVTDCG
jgi:hypothetical protein